MRSAAARRAGFAERTIASAVATGALLRLRRTWIALPTADPLLLMAARHGVVLSCVTQAKRLGLWRIDTGAGMHVACTPHAGRVRMPDGTRAHRSLPLVPRHPDALFDPIENVLALVAECQPFENALAIWESALNKGFATTEIVARLPLRGDARRILEEATPFSDSGLESFVPRRLRFLGLRIVPQAWIAGHHVDFLIGDRLVLQIDGRHHVGAQRTSDIRHDARLMLMGCHVIRVGYEQVTEDWPCVQHDIMRAVAQGLHLAR